MKNYVCINGTKREITEEQIQKLGLTAAARTFGMIVEIVQAGAARESLHVHETFCHSGREFEIIGIDHDKVHGEPTKPTITLMEKVVHTGRAMHNGDCEGGWADTELREWLNNDFINQLPEEIAKHICAVEKITHNASGEAVKTVDKLFVPSESEMFGSAIWSDHEDGQRYEAFDTSENRVRVDDEDDTRWYWTRSSLAGSASSFCIVGYYGGPYAYSATGAYAVPLCFCIS